MTHAVLDHWWPVTYDHGLIRADLDTVAVARREMYASAGLDPALTRLDAPLADCLSRLEPLSPAPTKELYLATSFGWTAYFANGCRGSDPFLPMKQLSAAIGTRALRMCATPETSMFPGVVLEVYDTEEAGADEHGYRRSIAAMNDGGRWVFEQSGTPFPFEETSRYTARLKRDRFTKRMLCAYVSDLGAEPVSDHALQYGGKSQGVLLDRPAQANLPHYALEEAKLL